MSQIYGILKSCQVAPHKKIGIFIRMNIEFLKCNLFKFCTLYTRNLVALYEVSVPLTQRTAIARGEDQQSSCTRQDSNLSCPVFFQTIASSPYHAVPIQIIFNTQIVIDLP
jgi:hypothetical protein